MSNVAETLFVEEPKPYQGSRNHSMEVLVGGLDGKIYEVEKGHHLNWVRKHLNIEDANFARELAKQSLTDQKSLPERFYDIFPSFVRILVVEKQDGVIQYSDGYADPEVFAYFETKSVTVGLTKTIHRVLRMFKQVETVQIYLHDSRELKTLSKRDFLLGGLK